MNMFSLGPRLAASAAGPAGTDLPRQDDRPAIAVMPFTENSDGDGRDLRDGITDDIITELSRFRELLVIGRNSSFGCESFARDTRRVAAELGVRYVLEGTVRRAGQRLRISCQLIDAESNAQVWSDRLDETMDDILLVQAEIAARVVGSVVPEMLQAEQQRAERLPIGSVPAYEMALKASGLIARGTNQGDVGLLSKGIETARQAAAIDPLCLRAHYAMAWGYCRRGTLGYLGVSARDDLEQATEAALRLRDLEPRSHSAYAVLGHIDMRRLRHQDALANLREANHYNPNDVTTLRWLSWQESNLGLAADAAAHADLSMRLSPRDRFLDYSYWCMGLAAYVDGKVEDALAYARRAIAVNRSYGGHYLLVAACLVELGQLEEAGVMAAALSGTHVGLLRSRVEGRTYFAIPELATRYQSALKAAAAAAGVDLRAEADEPPGETKAPIPAPTLPAIANPLTPREQQVLRLIATGLNNSAIAGQLALSEHTVKRHVANILMRLELPNRAAATAAAARFGLL